MHNRLLRSIIPAPRDNLETVYEIPLALFCLATEFWLFLVKLTDFLLQWASSASKDSDSGDLCIVGGINSRFSLGVHSTVKGILILILLFLTTTIVFRWRIGIICMLTGFTVVLITTVLTCLETLFVYLWQSWSTPVGSAGCSLTAGQQGRLALSGVAAASLAGTAWWTFSAHKSLALVLAAGGTGWERSSSSRVLKENATVHLHQTVKSAKLLSSCSSLASDVASIY